jgi:hypothetical protein
MLKAVDVAFNFQPFSAVLKFAPQNGTFLRTTVTLALRALIRQHKLCPSLGVTTGDFLPFKLNSQFHFILVSLSLEKSSQNSGLTHVGLKCRFQG